MKRNFCLFFSAVAAAFVGCADESVVGGTSVEPNTLAELSSSSEFDIPNSSEDVVQGSSSSEMVNVFSSSEIPMSSSSSENPVLSSSSSSPSWMFSSAYNPPVLCKVGGYGCAIIAFGDLWSGGLYVGAVDTVETDRYADDKSQFGINAGKWFLDVDSVDGGGSTIQWKVPIGDDEDSTSLLPVMEACGDGLCGTFELNKGDLTYKPFVQVGFYVAGFDSNGVLLSADVTNWTGICVMYRSSVAAELQLDLGDSLNRVLEYDLPNVDLRRAKTGTSECFEWSKFRRRGWGPKVEGWEDGNAGEMAARRLAKVVFQIQGASGTKGEFTISAIGTNLDE